MKRTIRDLEAELRKKTGEDELYKKTSLNTKNTFNPSVFLKLAKEVRKIFDEDERNSNSFIRPI